jgi:hypothetical protein
MGLLLSLLAGAYRPVPKAGSLSGLSVGTRFTAVGYGAKSVTIDKGPTFHYADIRYVATGGLEALNPSWLRISMNPALGDGGTCYGDSGGPNFLGAGAGETNIVAGAGLPRPVRRLARHHNHLQRLQGLAGTLAAATPAR